MRIRKGNKNYNILIFDMKRLLKSSGFWTAIIASIILVTAYKLTGSELIVTLIGGLFSIERIGKGAEDFVKANKGVSYNEVEGKEEII